MKIPDFIDQIVGGIFRKKPVYIPIIPPHTRKKMEESGITENELIRAFYSKTKDKGYKEGATVGITQIGDKVIGAVYQKDTQDPMQWVIIGCFAYRKKRKKRYWI